MTVRIEPPIAYRRADGSRGEIEDPGGWHYPAWTDDMAPHGGWSHLGWAPRPTTRWQRAKRHLLHGLIMGYPLRHVLAWVWRVDVREAAPKECSRCGGLDRYDNSGNTTAETAGLPCPRCCARHLLNGGRLTVWIARGGARQWFADAVERHRQDLLAHGEVDDG